MRINVKVLRALRKQGGLTTVEYAVAGGILVAGIIVAFITLGENVTAIIEAIADALVAP